LKILGYSLAILILGLAVSLRISWQESEQILPKREQVKLVATIKKEPKIYNSSQVLQIADGRIYVDLYPRYKVGDRVEVTGEFDDQGKMFNGQVKKIGKREGLASYLAGLRDKISQNIGALLPSREATLVAGTVLGVNTIEKSFQDELIKTGTIHVVVVSGQNLMIVAGIFLALAKYLGKRQSLALAITAAVGYALLTGFEPPVVRATLMVLASSLAIYFGRQSWPIWNLILAALIIIFFWPQAIFEISFQLTFAATMGIVTLGQFLARSWKKFPFFGQNAAIATSAYIFTAPIILFYFGRLSLTAPLANILVAEAVFPVMILGFLIAILSLILMPLAQILAYLAYIPAFYFVKVVEVFAKIPVGQVSLGKGSLAMVIGFYVLLLVLIFVWRKQSKSKRKV